MNEEQLIRDEAKIFHEWKLDGSDSVHAIDDFQKIKLRLNDFYNPESKAIFLDEILLLIKNNLEEHISEYHDGITDPNCRIDRFAEKLEFYIKQEIQTLPIIVHQKFNKNISKRDKVFISYSHYDEDYMNDIQRHFKPFKNKITYWTDKDIKVSTKWKESIEKAISEAKIAILLISTDFLGSDFIMNSEVPAILKAAEKEGAIILMMIIKPCAFEFFPLLNEIQAMNPPNKPVSQMDDNEKEELYVNLVRETHKFLV